MHPYDQHFSTGDIVIIDGEGDRVLPIRVTAIDLDTASGIAITGGDWTRRKLGSEVEFPTSAALRLSGAQIVERRAEVNHLIRGHRFYPTEHEYRKASAFALASLSGDLGAATVRARYFSHERDYWIAGYALADGLGQVWGYSRPASETEGTEGGTWGYHSLIHLEQYLRFDGGMAVYIERDTDWRPGPAAETIPGYTE